MALCEVYLECDGRMLIDAENEHDAAGLALLDVEDLLPYEWEVSVSRVEVPSQP